MDQSGDTSLDGIAELWVKIILTHIRSKKELKKDTEQKLGILEKGKKE